MGDRGLNASIWASQGNGNANPFIRSGDWNCPSCSFSNFQRRTECLQCSTSRPDTPRNSSPARSASQQNMIPSYVNNPSSLSHQRQATTTSPAAPITAAPPQHPAHPRLEKGLADSLWAPRNYSGRAEKADMSQVWIRVRSGSSQLLTRLIQWLAETLSKPRSLQHSSSREQLELALFQSSRSWPPL